MQAPVFIDNQLETAITAKGYVNMPFLSEQQVQACLQVEAAHPFEEPLEFFTSHWSRSEQYRRSVHEALIPIVSESVKGVFDRYRLAYAYFMVKKPGNSSVVTPHQDWTMVDEAKYRGITVWCPLVDLTHENGMFQVWESSHKILDNTRGSHIEPFYAHVTEYIWKHAMISVAAKAGEAIVFDHRLMHASPPNLSNEKRVALGLVLVPEEAQFIHYYKDPKALDDKIDRYQGDQEFLLKFAFGDTPEKLQFIDSVEPDIRTFNEEKVDAFFNRVRPEY